MNLRFIALSIALMLSLTSVRVLALTPQEVQQAVLDAQAAVETLPHVQEEDLAIVIAVSLSMPKASLEKLAIDARDAGLPLTFSGVGQTIENKPDEKPRTIIDRYGKSLIARHMEDFKFLTDLGVGVQIDPVVFTRHGISDVPRVMVVSVCRTACESSQALFAVRGDVSLRYALETLSREASAQIAKDPENKGLQKARQLIDGTLIRLGDRP